MQKLNFNDNTGKVWYDIGAVLGYAFGYMMLNIMFILFLTIFKGELSSTTVRVIFLTTAGIVLIAVLLKRWLRS